MFQIEDYRERARQNESVFRNILSDLRDNGGRWMGGHVPKDLDSQSSLEILFEKYSTGNRYGRFTICDFVRQDSTAHVAVENLATMSGRAAQFHYVVGSDSSVTYDKVTNQGMS